MKTRGKALTGALCALLLLVSATAATAVSRGEVVQEVVTALGLPEWGGARQYEDVPPGHPQEEAIETAAALGILLPGDHFHPDIEATRAEALGLAFLGMGWRKEGKIVQALTEGDPTLPPHLAAFVTLGKELSITPPDHFLEGPVEDCSASDLDALGGWLRRCNSGRPLWERSFTDPSGARLVVHRENVGGPPSGWAVQVMAGNVLQVIERAASTLKKMGLPVVIVDKERYTSLRIGPYKHFYQAWKRLGTMPGRYSPSIVPHGGTRGNALFWAAVTGTPEELQPTFGFAGQVADKERVPLSRIASRACALGAVNGGFFHSRGDPIGTIVDKGGIPVSAPWYDRSAVGWTDDGNGVHFGNGFYRGWVDGGGMRHGLDRINRTPGADQLALFTSHPGRWRTVPPGGKVLLDSGLAVRQSRYTGRVALSPGTQLLIGRGNATTFLDALDPGSMTRFDLRWDDPAMEGMDYVLQAGPMLVRKGRPATAPEGFSASVRNRRHPRSLVGYDGAQLWWMVIDGRNSWHSRGATLAEARRIAYAEGLQWALNLDGGGSTTLWWDGIVVNSPSDGRERPLPYGVVFRAMDN